MFKDDIARLVLLLYLYVVLYVYLCEPNLESSTMIMGIPDLYDPTRSGYVFTAPHRCPARVWTNSDDISGALVLYNHCVVYPGPDHDPPSHTLACKCYHHCLIIWSKTYRLWFCWDLSLFSLSIGQCFQDIWVLTFTLSSIVQCHDVI